MTLTVKGRVSVGCTYCEQAKFVTCLATCTCIYVRMTTYIYVASYLRIYHTAQLQLHVYMHGCARVETG